MHKNSKKRPWKYIKDGNINLNGIHWWGVIPIALISKVIHLGNNSHIIKTVL